MYRYNKEDKTALHERLESGSQRRLELNSLG